MPPSMSILKLYRTGKYRNYIYVYVYIYIYIYRKYAKKEGTVFKPEDIGIALVSSYEKLKIPLNKPNLRAQMEKDMQLVATGAKDNESMLAECLHTMQEIFNRVTSLKPHFVSAFQEHITHHSLLPHSTNGGHHGGNNTREESKEANNNSPSNNPNHHNGLNGSDPEGANALFMLCSLCKVHQLRLMKSRIGNFFIGCVGYPQCQNTISIPDFVTNVYSIYIYIYIIGKCIGGAMRRMQRF